MKILKPFIYLFIAIPIVFSCNTVNQKKKVSGEIYFPPPGQGMDKQKKRTPEEMGLQPQIIGQMGEFIRENPFSGENVEQRWALWRNGYLIHVEGDFDKTVDVASLRKTWHALTVGAAIHQGKIPSLDQKISVWLPELKGNDADATWRHVITQSAGFDYPYAGYPDFKPGEMWTYSDWNPIYLCTALAHVYGKKDFHDQYEEVIRTAYFDTIGMQGWKIGFVKDASSGMEDGIRFHLSLDHMGRLGLLVLARGTWNGKELVSGWFVEQMETKQTRGMRVNYDGPNDGKCYLGQYGDRFRECPYGFLTWVNTDGDFFPGADRDWAWGAGARGTMIMWNQKNGVVFAGVGISSDPVSYSIPHIIEQNIVTK
ncbi:MAG: serine hydrolase domain-containing protein [Bacteroidales bacterium]|nr:serine hydrolase domain-containing protein [Bacteroidales bacterium]